jgi:hypothetical protein
VLGLEGDGEILDLQERFAGGGVLRRVLRGSGCGVGQRSIMP